MPVLTSFLALLLCLLLTSAAPRPLLAADADALARRLLGAWEANDLGAVTEAGHDLLALHKVGAMRASALTVDALWVLTVQRLLLKSGGPLDAEEAARALLEQSASIYPRSMHERMAQLALAASICSDHRWREVTELLKIDRSHPDRPTDVLSNEANAQLMIIGNTILSPGCLGVTEAVYRLVFRSLKPEQLEPALTQVLGRAQYLFFALLTAGWVLEQDGNGAADAIYQRALALAAGTPGVGPEQVARILRGLSGFLSDYGRFADAERIERRIVNFLELSLGPDDPGLASIGLIPLGKTLFFQGRHVEAEALLRRALAILSATAVADESALSQALNGLGMVVQVQGRAEEAATLYHRALVLANASPSKDARAIADYLGNLAAAEFQLGHTEKAETLARQSLMRSEAVLSPHDPSLAYPLADLAVILALEGRYDEAEALERRALAIRESALGPDHPDIARSLAALGEIAQLRGNVDEALALLLRALAISKAALGPDNPTLAGLYSDLALAEQSMGELDLALEAARAATRLATHRIEEVSQADPKAIGRLAHRSGFVLHVALLSNAVSRGGSEIVLGNEAFLVGQMAQQTEASVALQQLRMRFAAGSTVLAGAVRSYQDALAERGSLEELLVQAVSRPSDQREQANEQGLHDRLAAVESHIAQAEALFRQEFPDYAALAMPTASSLADVQHLLGADEALLSYLTSADGTYLWAVTGKAVRFRRIDMTADALAQKIKRLREPLDATNIVSLANIRPFDAALAHELYETLLAPAEDMLTGIHRLMIVPHGPLEGLPFAVLVGKAPPGPLASWKDYKNVDWLIRRFSLTTLPSVGSLQSLRATSRGRETAQAFVGFGDPLLDGHPAGPDQAASRGALFRAGPDGVLADPAMVRELPPLPDTADELLTMAKELGGDAGSVYLRERATEDRVKTMDLTRVRVLAFATHGLVAGDIGQLGEPALVLTPPAEASLADDGLLTASEVAALKLDADWVVLSACNTAAPDGEPGAKGLSGLARAFFYAGARALLVSHWPVVSAAAAAITTGAAGALEKDPAIGRAEALRRAMLLLADDPKKPYYGHPLFWAPFTVVGDGR